MSQARSVYNVTVCTTVRTVYTVHLCRDFPSNELDPSPFCFPVSHDALKHLKIQQNRADKYVCNTIYTAINVCTGAYNEKLYDSYMYDIQCTIMGNVITRYVGCNLRVHGFEPNFGIPDLHTSETHEV